ncbi:VOC family protein [Priestia koreensis]|uniref:VOC domain-containing protein n=1 Tax=Priestia koreensis TaxID=284581 RepID=A0A0M0KVI0_9BACI|nr:glyoxalase/bleomycin resistance/dioxygenase family protein [Priestia koreensis]KOO42826.1 hypothetical protein AMD01_16930 [Priestia koreensis]MCM3005422.1 glyoxalase/bleomycin resistance/dioxygenase family protein [Priestia koreensis]
MEILHVNLKTTNLKRMKTFYTEQLRLRLLRSGQLFFTVEVGETKLTFEAGEEQTRYHVAFRLTTRGFNALQNHLAFLPNPEGETSLFWKGRQRYLYDPDGNILELLERESTLPRDFLDIGEVGMPSDDVSEFAAFLRPIETSLEAKGDAFRFYGDETGVLVLVKVGRHWYPTMDEATISPIHLEIRGREEQLLTHPTYPYTIAVTK